MKKIYLHVGFGKTGSSALQSYLSLNMLPINSMRESLVYCSVTNDGELIYGEALAQAANNNPLKYEASNPEINKLINIEKVCEGLNRLFADGKTPILSQEDWGRRGNEFIKSGLLEKIGCKAHVVAYVRPQVEWLNSAWWQWYAWDSNFKSPEDVIDAWGCRFMCWAEQLRNWEKNINVCGLSVNPQPKDIVADFLKRLGIKETAVDHPYARNNTSLSLPLILAIKNIPIERKPHDANVDAILSGALNLPGKSPWIIKNRLIESVIDGCFKDNIDLVNMMTAESALVMLNDSRWWKSEYYTDRLVISDEDLRLSSEEALQLAAMVVEGLLKKC